MLVGLPGTPFSNEWIDSFYKGKNSISSVKTPIYNKIIVTGPQRSGTRFVGMLLNDALKDIKARLYFIHQDKVIRYIHYQKELE